MSMPLPAVGDSICMCDKSALTSVGSEPSVLSVSPSVDWLPSVSSDVLHSLSLGKGMDRLSQILTCGLPLRQFKAVSLSVIGSLGHRSMRQYLPGCPESWGSQLPTPPLAWQVGSMLSKVLMVSEVS